MKLKDLFSPKPSEILGFGHFVNDMNAGIVPDNDTFHHWTQWANPLIPELIHSGEYQTAKYIIDLLTLYVICYRHHNKRSYPFRYFNPPKFLHGKDQARILVLSNIVCSAGARNQFAKPYNKFWKRLGCFLITYFPKEQYLEEILRGVCMMNEYEYRYMNTLDIPSPYIVNSFGLPGPIYDCAYMGV